MHNPNNNHLIDHGLLYCTNYGSKKVLNLPKWRGVANPMTASSSGGMPRSAIFHSATNAARESVPYCSDTIFQPQHLPVHATQLLTCRPLGNQSRGQYQSQQQQHHHQQQQSIETLRGQQRQHSVYKKHNPPLTSVHYRAARQAPSMQGNNNNNNNHHEEDEDGQQESQATCGEQHCLLSSDSTSNSYSNRFSPGAHYQHYYSYHYKQQPTWQQVTTGRKLPDTVMATARKNLLESEARPNHAIARRKAPGTALYDNERSALQLEQQQHNVLKEKMPNNNIIGSAHYDADSDWLGADLLGVTDNFMDVKDVDAYHETLHNSYRAGGRLIKMNDSLVKRKLRPCSESESQWPLDANDDWLDDDGACGDAGAAIERHAFTKLPLTPRRGRSKKHSPHKVLHYGGGNQSPRLQRAAPCSAALRSRSPAPGLRVKKLPCNRLVERNKNDTGDCYVHVTKSCQPSERQQHREQETPAVQRECGGATAIYDGGSSSDGDTVDDDDVDDLDNESNGNDSSNASNASSDSEDGYRAYAYKLTYSLERISCTQSCPTSEACEDELVNPDSVLVPSLFPNVPPYLAFSSNTLRGPQVPSELHRVLKWRVTNVMPKVVRCVLANSGMRLLKKTNDWMGIWGKHMKSPCFKTIRPYQKINHLPGSFKIGRKDSCWKNLLKQMNKHGKKDFGFMPKTYIIPHDLNLLRKHWPKYAQRNVKWIIKPPASARGTGIRVVDRWAQIPKRKPLIVQKYIERPLLINGSKFDLRLYVLVTSINPLRVFMYHNGLARFASVKYSDRSDTLNDRCMHLTNYSINKLSSNYAKNEDVNACHGHKWTIKSLWSYLANRGVRTDYLWEALRNLVLRTILAGEQSINNMIRLNMESKYSCFELFGFDVLLDADLIPWLLEVNISPSLHSELPLDTHVKAPLVQGVLNTALFNVPPKLSYEAQKEIVAELSLPPGPLCYDKRIYVNYLSRAEKIKHTTYTRKTMENRDEYINGILDHLTPDDVRCLIVAEDELARCSPLERIFPTADTHKYLKYTENPRYYNRLLDAWEARYAHNRAKGILLLQQFCEEKYHLEVPSLPAKKPLKCRTQTLMMTRQMILTALAMTATSRKMRKLTVQRQRGCKRTVRSSDSATMTEQLEKDGTVTMTARKVYKNGANDWSTVDETANSVKQKEDHIQASSSYTRKQKNAENNKED